MKNENTFLNSPLKFKWFLLTRLPMAFLAGLKLTSIAESHSEVTLRYGFLTKNPFKSIYFACLAMAGELASGVLSIYHVSLSGKSVSLLVVKMEAEFCKKAIGKICFHCEDGELIKKAIDQSIATGQGSTVKAVSKGVNEAGETVAIFTITWSYKAR